jgi:G3E family GTPase
LNKIDTVDEALVSQSLAEIHQAVPGIRVLPTLYSEVDSQVIWEDLSQVHYPGCNHDHQHHEGFTLDLEEHSHHHGHHHGENQFTAFAFVDLRALDEERFKSFLERLPWELFRVKGPVRFPDRTMLLNFVGGQSNWEPWEDGQGTRLAFVGWKINSEEMLERLEQCILQE